MNFSWHADVVCVPLIGGIKSTQKRDIKTRCCHGARFEEEDAMKKLAAYDSADYLTDEETIAEYLSAALQRS